MRTIQVFTLTICMFFAVLSLTAQIINTWDGSTSTAWATGTNWSLGHAPLSAEDVIIPIGVPNNPVVTTTTATCKSLTLNTSAGMTISTGTLTVVTNFTSLGMLLMNNASGNLVVQQDLYFDNGSTLIMNVAAEIYVTRHIEFRAGSSINPASGTFITDGSVQSMIRIYETAAIYNLKSAKSSTADNTNFSSASNHTLTIKGDLTVAATSKLLCAYTGTIILQGDLDVAVGGICQLGSGTLSFEGNTTTWFNLGDAGNYIKNLQINKTTGYQIQLHSAIDVDGNLNIQSGILFSTNYTINVAGNWTNNIGTSSFLEGSCTVIFDGTANQTISTEEFHYLIMNKSGGALIIPAGSTVDCESYDWTAGILTVSGGTLTANDMVDAAMLGTIILSSGYINFHQDTAQYLHLRGTLNISGGELHIYGMSYDTFWPYEGNGSLTMSAGLIDVHDKGIGILDLETSFPTNITGGTIRCAGDFYNERSDFNPTGGSVEMYSAADATLYVILGSLHNLRINKAAREGELTRSNTVTADPAGNMYIKGSLYIMSGIFVAPPVLHVEGGWNNYVGESGFVEGTGLVVFEGNGDGACYSETFNNLEINKTGTGYLHIPAGYAVTCNSYNWTAGALRVTGGTFTALEMVDNAIKGTINLISGIINLQNDTSTNFSMDGNLNISGGELHMYGGSAWSNWPLTGSASLTMSDGLIEVHDAGIGITNLYPFTTNITGGLIRTAKNFYCNRSDFTPTGGTLELYSSTGSSLEMQAGSLYNLTINKTPSTTVHGYVSADINGIFTIDSGNFWAPPIMTVAGNWSNNVGTAAFNELTGTVTFDGNTDKTVTAENFYHLVINKGTGNRLAATGNIGVNGNFTISGGIFEAPASMSVAGDWTNSVGYTSFIEGSGTVTFIGSNNSTLSQERFNHLIVNKNSVSSVIVGGYSISTRGDLTIQSGILNSNSNSIAVAGAWTNLVGTAGFIEGTGVVNFWGTADQIVPSEEFYGFESNKLSGNLIIPAGSIVTAHWMHIFTDIGSDGRLLINGGSLTVSSNYDNLFAGVILTAGYFELNNTVDFLEIYDLDIQGGTLNLLNLDTIYMYPGDIEHWRNTSLSGGILDCHEADVVVNTWDASGSVTGGTIKTSGSVNLIASARGTFNPTGGSFELYGAGTGRQIQCLAGNSFYNLQINLDSSASMIGVGPLDINGDFILSSGYFTAPETITIAGNWINSNGPLAFIENFHLVTFDGASDQIVTSEDFDYLALNKSGGNLIIPTGSNVTCYSYDWEAGNLTVSGGTFTANDMADEAIRGTINLSLGYIHFYQDENQWLNLNGTLNISGGELHIYGMYAESYWPYWGDAALNMSDGVIDVHDKGIYIYSVWNFPTNITGGTIRSAGMFMCGRSDFSPTGGTVEMYSVTDVYLGMGTSSLHNLTINKYDPLGLYVPTVSVFSGSQHITGTLTVTAGIFDLNGHSASAGNDINVYGRLKLPENSDLSLFGNSDLTVYNGGFLEALGTETGPAIISRHGTYGYHGFSVESGGTLSASYVIFEYLDLNGVNIKDGAVVDAVNCLNNCTFRYGFDEGTLLTINNAQDLVINNAVFPENTPGSTYNVSKTLDQGSVTFVGPSGDFSGADFELDDYNRINWPTVNLPPVETLIISYNSITDEVELSWTYPLAVNHFHIYRCEEPYGEFHEYSSSTSTFWSEPVTGDKYYYYVTAVGE